MRGGQEGCCRAYGETMLSTRRRLDNLCTEVLEKSGAKAAVVIVADSSMDSGMAIKEDFALAGGAYHLERLPKLLRFIAERIERNGKSEVKP